MANKGSDDLLLNNDELNSKDMINYYKNNTTNKSEDFSDGNSKNENNHLATKDPKLFSEKDSEITLQNNNAEEVCDHNYNANRNWYQSYFSKIRPGSIRASIFSLSILSLGTGCLSLPQRFGQLSILLCSLEVIIGGFAAYWTLNLLILASIKSKETTYAKVIEKICGESWAKFLDWIMIVYILGILVIYHIMGNLYFYYILLFFITSVFKMIGAFIFKIGYKSDFDSLTDFYLKSFWGVSWIKITIMLLTASVFIIPLNLLKDVTKLRFSSIFGLFCLLLVAILIIIQLPQYLDYNSKLSPPVAYNLYDVSSAFTTDLLFFKGTATIFYAYNCHVGIYPIYEKLINNNVKRTNKVLMRSIAMDATFYLVIGITGYLTDPTKTKSMIIEREQIGSTDYAMTMGQLLIVLLLFAKIPANYNALRISIFQVIWGNAEIETKK